MKEQTYIDFICSNCGVSYWMENKFSAKEREQVIYEHCSKECMNCGSSESIQWKINKE